jgi:hypothetical protein
MPYNFPALELMLHVVTARGTLSWANWQNSFSSLANGRVLPQELSPAEAMRILDSLAHIEVTGPAHGMSLAAAPASLARLPIAGLPRAVLCGGRSPEAERSLAEAAASAGCRFSAIAPGPAGTESPRTLFIEADSPAVLAKVASTIGATCAETPPAWAIANLSGSVQEYRQTLAWRSEPEPPLQSRELDPATLRFADSLPARHGLRLIQYFPRRLPSYHELRDGQSFARTDRDWAIYAVLSEHGRNVIIHDLHARTVAVPASAPLPRLFARTLALCSGLAPAWLPAAQSGWHTAEPRGYWVYAHVPSTIASLVLEKLGQDPLPLQLPQDFVRRIQSQTPP